jgi:hypothetical protein
MLAGKGLMMAEFQVMFFHVSLKIKQPKWG